MEKKGRGIVCPLRSWYKMISRKQLRKLSRSSKLCRHGRRDHCDKVHHGFPPKKNQCVWLVWRTNHNVTRMRRRGPNSSSTSPCLPERKEKTTFFFFRGKKKKRQKKKQKVKRGDGKSPLPVRKGPVLSRLPKGGGSGDSHSPGGGGWRRGCRFLGGGGKGGVGGAREKEQSGRKKS